jgi:transcriptional regulator with XRE-family HTH domain
MKALRQLAGYRNVEELARAIGAHRGMKTTTLRMIEREQRTADHRELQEIAEVCGVPVAWFTADFSRLAEISEDPRTVIARMTAEAVRRSEARRAGISEDHPLQPGEGHAP